MQQSSPLTDIRFAPDGRVVPLAVQRVIVAQLPQVFQILVAWAQLATDTRRGPMCRAGRQPLNTCFQQLTLAPSL